MENIWSKFTALPLYRKLALGGAILLFIDLFLPWWSVPFGLGSANGWNGVGPLVGILVLALIGWEGLRLAGKSLELNVKTDLVTAGLAGLTALFTLILFFDAAGSGGFGAWIGLILLIGLGYSAYLAFNAGDGKALLQSSTQSAEQPPADEPTPPPNPQADEPPTPDSPTERPPNTG